MSGIGVPVLEKTGDVIVTKRERAMIRKSLLGLACTLAVTSSSLADTVTIGAAKDNTLYEHFQGLFSNGVGRYCFAGINGGGEIRRAVLQFDVAAAVPSGATIDSVTLTLNMSRTNSGDQAQDLHRLLADWGEAGSIASGQEGGGGAALNGDATWIHGFFSTTPWATEGGDFDPTVSATQVVGGVGFYSWSGAQLAADVQSMLDDGANNYGWIVIGVESGGDTAKRYDTRDNLTPGNRPALEITYSLPCVGDLNGDMAVDTADLGTLIAQFGTAGPGADLNGDMIVDTADLGILIAAFGQPCP